MQTQTVMSIWYTLWYFFYKSTIRNVTDFSRCHIQEKHNTEKNGSRYKNGINIISRIIKKMEKEGVY